MVLDQACKRKGQGLFASKYVSKEDKHPDYQVRLQNRFLLVHC